MTNTNRMPQTTAIGGHEKPEDRACACVHCGLGYGKRINEKTLLVQASQSEGMERAVFIITDTAVERADRRRDTYFYSSKE